jgi:ANTAR domain-containing protein
MVDVVDLSETVFEQARGVIAARLDIDPDFAGRIIDRVARQEGVSRSQIAADIVASCTDSRVYLPRTLYPNGHAYESAA